MKINDIHIAKVTITGANISEIKLFNPNFHHRIFSISKIHHISFLNTYHMISIGEHDITIHKIHTLMIKMTANASNGRNNTTAKNSLNMRSTNDDIYESHSSFTFDNVE
jgi:hypothetical protein